MYELRTQMRNVITQSNKNKAIICGHVLYQFILHILVMEDVFLDNSDNNMI